MQCSPVANTGTSATPNNDSAEDAEEAFRAETSRAEDEEALDWAGLDDQPVKEGEEWNADEEAGAVTTPLVEDAPRIESRPAPHNALHAHTPVTSEAASTQRSPAVISGTPGIPEPEDRGVDWDPPLHDTPPPDEAVETPHPTVARADPSPYRCRRAVGVAPGRSIAAHNGADEPSTGARTRGQDARRRGAQSSSRPCQPISTGLHRLGARVRRPEGPCPRTSGAEACPRRGCAYAPRPMAQSGRSQRVACARAQPHPGGSRSAG